MTSLPAQGEGVWSIFYVQWIVIFYNKGSIVFDFFNHFGKYALCSSIDQPSVEGLAILFFDLHRAEYGVFIL
jgi:hypothetical protein